MRHLDDISLLPLSRYDWISASNCFAYGLTDSDRFVRGIGPYKSEKNIGNWEYASMHQSLPEMPGIRFSSVKMLIFIDAAGRAQQQAFGSGAEVPYQHRIAEHSFTAQNHPRKRRLQPASSSLEPIK